MLEADRECRALKVLRDPPGPKDQKVTPVLQAQRGQSGRKGPKVMRERLGPQVQQARRDLKV